MKKVLLASAVVLAGVALAVPAFAQGEDPASSNRMNQKKYVSEADIAAEANRQVAAHEAEINEEAEKDAAVVAAKAALESYGSGHLYGDYVAKLDAARADARNVVRNKHVAQIQEKLREVAMAQGNYWNDPTGVQDNKPNNQRIADDQAAQGGASTNPSNPGQQEPAINPGNTTPSADQTAAAQGAAAQAGKAEAGTRAAAKGNAKTLPKTHAAK